ncbi:LemA family protein [Pseudomonas mosselii]|uniref:LemA family protein n=1 Tax=Pseudomonas mosselii TaxID=78327 RepID=UPI001F1CA425|nr:LemA family protein [Pseudomonas mosselii]
MDLFALILLAVLIGVPLIVISLYNGIVGNHNRVKRAWADVLTYERQKSKVLDALQEQAGLYRDHEQGVLAGITRLRSAIAELPVEADGKTLAKAEDATRSLLGGLRVAFEAYPELKASELMNNLMREIAEQQQNVGAAIVIFNGEVERFNNGIQMFPGSLVNSVMNKHAPVTAFTDIQAASAFDYTPNL